MDKILGYTEVELETRFSEIRTKETNFSNFYADLVREELRADLCIVNAGTIRSDMIIPVGPLTFKTL
jgi:5'-nucleotidase